MTAPISITFHVTRELTGEDDTFTTFYRVVLATDGRVTLEKRRTDDFGVDQWEQNWEGLHLVPIALGQIVKRMCEGKGMPEFALGQLQTP